MVHPSSRSKSTWKNESVEPRCAKMVFPVGARGRWVNRLNWYTMCHVQHSTLSREIWGNISCIVLLPNWYLKNTYQQCQALTQSLELFYKKHGYLKANSKVGWIVHNSPLRFSGVSIPRYIPRKKAAICPSLVSATSKKTLTTSKFKCWHTALFFSWGFHPQKESVANCGWLFYN